MNCNFIITLADLNATHPDNSMIKHADDTYLITSASGAHTCATENNNNTTCSVRNTLTLNMAKTTEIVIYDSQRSSATHAATAARHRPSRLTPRLRRDVRRLSASDHIRQVVGDCSQSLYALRVLRHYGLADVCLHTVFRSVVVAKLLYACTAWSGFITASDRHRVDAFLHRSKHCGYCHPDLPTFNKLLDSEGVWRPAVSQTQ